MASHSSHRSSSSHHHESDRRGRDRDRDRDSDRDRDRDRDAHHHRSSKHRDSTNSHRDSTNSHRDSTNSHRDSKSKSHRRSSPQEDRNRLSHRSYDSERRTIPPRSSPVPSPTRSPLPPPRSRPLPPPLPPPRPLPPPPPSSSPHVSASDVVKDAAAVRILGRLSAEPHPPANSPPKSPPANSPPKSPPANTLRKTPQANSPPKSPLVAPRRPRSQAVRRNPTRHAAVSRPAPVDDVEEEENVKKVIKYYTVKQESDLIAGVKRYQPILGLAGKKLWLVLQKTYPSIASRSVSGLKHKCKVLMDEGRILIEDGEDILDSDHSDLVESLIVAMSTNDKFIRKIGDHVLTAVQEDRVECVLECVKEVMARLKEEN